jgi:ribosomal protein S18 acetylase RimI-like enzyme
MSQPDVAVRIAVAADADALERAGTDVFDNDVERTWLTDFFANPSNLLAIALAAGEVVGMASGVAYVHPDKPLQLFVNEVGVAARFQRRGVGALLVRALLDRGRDLGCTQAWVATEDDNRAARALYASVGGIEDEERAVVYVFPLADAAAPDPNAPGA